MIEDNELENLHINWFPGHMFKAQKMIKENLKLVDVVIELLDARIPYSSANPVIKEIIGNKAHIIALNKADLADDEATKAWIQKFKQEGIDVVAIDSINGKGIKTLISKVEALAHDKVNKLADKGVNARAARAMILGIPNVGKSSLINKLLGATKAKVADKPGVTRTKRWIKINKNLELLDTPGVLWPKFENQLVGVRLAISGAINDEVYDMEKVIINFIKLMKINHAKFLVERYKIKEELPDSVEEIINLIGKKRGCLRSGGVIDQEKVRRVILNEYRAGKLGKITLDGVTEDMEVKEENE